MSTVTPNIGIYIPAAGETNYDQAFASGMVNIDQHDHSGGPNKGLAIATEGLGAFSVTFDKLNVNVVNPLTGISTDPILMNQLVLLDPLKSIYTLGAASSVGFLTLNGTIPAVRTFQNSSTITWSHGNGDGNPQASVNIAGISPVPVANGGTGLTALSTYDILCGGTSPTGPIQQVSGEGAVNQYLGSNGINMLPSWKTLPAPTAQNVLTTSVTLTASQVNNLSSSPIILVPAQGAGTVIVIYECWAKLNYAGTDVFHNGSSVRLYWGGSSTEVGFVFVSGCWKDGSGSSPLIFYYSSNISNTSSSTGYSQSTVENSNVTIGVNSSNFSGGSGNTVTVWCSYSIMTI